MEPGMELVEVLGVKTIVPSRPSARHKHFLSNLDLRFDGDNYYAQCVFLFRIDDKNAKNVDAQSLRASASKALSAFPVLAGRLCKGDDDSKRTQIDVNDAGIPFYEARCTARLDQWPELRRISIDLQLNPPNSPILPTCAANAPLIRLQATRFDCGGVALGFSALHMLVDGANAIDFIKAWGELHGGGVVAAPPNFASWMLAARDPPLVKVPLDSRFEFVESGDSHVQQRANAKWALKTVVFAMDSSAVDRCVRDVEKGEFGYGRATSYEAISALFWSAMTRARGGGTDDEERLTSYTVPFSVARKGRFDPQLPDGFFGNAVVMGLATSTIGQIRQSHFSFAAALIHSRAAAYSIELAKSAIDCFELRLRAGKPAAGLVIGGGCGADVLSTNFVGFPVYNIDFGWGNKLEQMIFSFPMENGEGVISILPTSRGGRSREIAVCLREDALKRLCDDAMLQLYCSP